MLPVLSHSAEKIWAMQDLISRISDDLNLTRAEREEQMPSGGTKIGHRVYWAKTYLKQAGLVDQPERGKVRITKRGLEVLGKQPAKIDIKLLLNYPEFQAFLKKTKPPGKNGKTIVKPQVKDGETPEEQIDAASDELNAALREALLEKVLSATPTSFEKLIIDLLLKMRYGGSNAEAGEHLGQTADGGVDGVIREDRLGLDRVYLQAKRYKPGNSVGSEAVQAFIGALMGHGSQKGVLITTSDFTAKAREAAKQSGSVRVVLINGDELTKLMIQSDVGVRIGRTVLIKRIDLEYFGDIESE